MTDHPHLFGYEVPEHSLAASKVARDAAIDQVARNASETWINWARAAVLTVATRRATFTSLDVWNLMHAWGIAEPREMRAMGSVIRDLFKDGVIEPTDHFVTGSAGVRNHAHPKRVWRLVTSEGRVGL